MSQSCTRRNECGDSQSQTQSCGSACNECGPRYGSWGTCSSTTYQRSRSVGYDCQADTSQSETCKGTISGTMFDSTLPGSSCGNPGEGVAGVTVSAAASGTAPGGCSLSGSAVTDGNGNYSIGNLCSPATYLMTIDAPANYIDAPESYCDGPSLWASLTSQGQTEDKDFGLTRIYDGWVQVNDGDVYAAGVISNYIPPTCTGACAARFLLDGAGGDPGVVGYGGLSANFGPGEVSSTNWLVNAKYQGKRYGFEFWRTHWNVSSQAESDWTNVELFTSASKPTQPPIHAKVYYANNDMIIADNTWQISAGEKIAVLVRGNLDIKAKISVAEGGFLAFAVQGDININPSINSEDGQGAIEGIYISDGEIDTGRATTKLILEGTFVGWTGVTLGRDFQTVRNNTEPAEVFVYRPDIIAAAPSYMKRPAYVWEEVAP